MNLVWPLLLQSLMASWEWHTAQYLWMESRLCFIIWSSKDLSHSLSSHFILTGISPINTCIFARAAHKVNHNPKAAVELKILVC